jgi:hypothetical protein
MYGQKKYMAVLSHLPLVHHYIRMCMCIYIYTHTHTRIFMHTHTQTHTDAQTHVTNLHLQHFKVAPAPLHPAIDSNCDFVLVTRHPLQNPKTSIHYAFHVRIGQCEVCVHICMPFPVLQVCLRLANCAIHVSCATEKLDSGTQRRSQSSFQNKRALEEERHTMLIHARVCVVMLLVRRVSDIMCFSVLKNGQTENLHVFFPIRIVARTKAVLGEKESTHVNRFEESLQAAAL